MCFWANNAHLNKTNQFELHGTCYVENRSSNSATSIGMPKFGGTAFGANRRIGRICYCWMWYGTWGQYSLAVWIHVKHFSMSFKIVVERGEEWASTLTNTITRIQKTTLAVANETTAIVNEMIEQKSKTKQIKAQQQAAIVLFI